MLITVQVERMHACMHIPCFFTRTAIIKFNINSWNHINHLLISETQLKIEQFGNNNNAKIMPSGTTLS